jgi:hypothetical protein
MASYIRAVLEEMYDTDDWDSTTELYKRFYYTEAPYAGGLKIKARYDFILWVKELIELAGVPKGFFRKCIIDNDFTYNTDNIEEFLGAIEANYNAMKEQQAEDAKEAKEAKEASQTESQTPHTQSETT